MQFYLRRAEAKYILPVIVPAESRHILTALKSPQNIK